MNDDVVAEVVVAASVAVDDVVADRDCVECVVAARGEDVAVVVAEELVADAVHDLACIRPGEGEYCCIGRAARWDTGFPSVAPWFKLESEKITIIL